MNFMQVSKNTRKVPQMEGKPPQMGLDTRKTLGRFVCFLNLVIIVLFRLSKLYKRLPHFVLRYSACYS
mgnify:CR=1 FL=1